jgi:arylsulfatase A-like enzyme
MKNLYKSKILLTLFILTGYILPFCTGTHKNGDKPPPNFVFILVDDLSWADLTYNGSKVYETPNVDRLAQQGMVFSDFYSGGPVCSPTRASILTGKYTARTGITTYLITPERDAEYVTHELPLEECTIAEALKEQDYATGYFGKWHLGYAQQHWAANQGFDIAIGGLDSQHAWAIAYPDIDPPDDVKNNTHIRFFSPHHMTHMEDGPEGEYLTDRLTNETISFIRDKKDKPFLAYLSFHTVHTPLQAKPEAVQKYAEKISRMGLDTLTEKDNSEKAYQNNPNYAAMVHHMDENVGRLMDAVEEMGLDENTVVIFTSDNGGKGSVTSNLPLKGMKHNLDEGGIRVATIIRWTGKIQAGSVCSEPLISNDFYPTMLELANAPLIPEQHMDGVSIKDVLLGNKTETGREAIYWHYPHSRMEGAIRKGDYKLLYYYKTGEVHLYNLVDDIGELNDLSLEEPEKTEEMLGMLKTWLNEVGARFPADLVNQIQTGR